MKRRPFRGVFAKAVTGLAVAMLSCGLVLASCYRPERRDCSVVCGEGFACPHGMSCSNGFCTAGDDACSSQSDRSPAVPPPACTPGARRCGPSSAVEVCDDDETTWLELQRCAADTEICADARCLGCAPGAVRCASPRRLEVCEASERYRELEECPDWSPVCAGSGCSPEVRVSAGATHACAVLSSGEVRCWGSNSAGQLGTGDVLQRKGAASDPPLRSVALGLPAVAVAAGGTHTCALLRDGSVKCWGRNSAGQLGLGDTEDRGDEPGELGEALPAVDFGPNRAALALSAGSRHSCALLDDGSVRCWGANESGQLGLGDTEPRGDEPGELGFELARVLLGPATAVAVDAGDEHTCALLADGQVSCFGANLLGELGTGDMVNHGSWSLGADAALPRVPLATNERAVAISAGANHSCAVLRDGGLVCWGFNRAGQLGVGDSMTRGQRSEGDAAKLERVNLGAERTALAVSAGASHTCALLSERSVVCWGINLFGTLGSGDMVSPRGAIPSELGEGLLPIDLGTDAGGPWRAGALSAGLDFTCAALDGGAVKCWGFNGSGQLGLGDVEPRGDDVAELGDALPVLSLE